MTPKCKKCKSELVYWQDEPVKYHVVDYDKKTGALELGGPLDGGEPHGGTFYCEECDEVINPRTGVAMVTRKEKKK